MKSSEAINELATALSEFQGEVTDAHKTSQGYNYRYADLGEVLGLIRPLMAKHGLSVTQFPLSDTINAGITSRLMHKSGQWLEQDLVMGVTASTGMSHAQSVGLVLSYCRRYALVAILGITQVDPDAEVEEPEIVPASDDDKALLTEWMESGELPAKTSAWLKKKSNWNNMTHNQAQTIIYKLKEKQNA